jgi:hypothetical protein
MPQTRCGAYLLTVGETLYVGSSWHTYRRKCSHISDLRGGKHDNKMLQKAWDKSPEQVTFSVVRHVEKREDDTKQLLRDKLRAAEQELLLLYAKNPKLANVSMNARGPDTRLDMKAKWQDPAFRAKMKEAMANKPEASPETRRKMAEAKTGANNPKARPVTVVWPCGRSEQYPTGSSAAKSLGVTQQLVDAWLKGIVALPGRGRTCRKLHLAGIDVFYTGSKQ